MDANDLASGVCGACRARTAAALGRGAPASVSGGSREPALSRGHRAGHGRSRLAPRHAALPSALRPPHHARAGPAGSALGAARVLVAAAVVSGVLWYLRVRPDPADLKAVTDALPRPGKKRPPAEVRLPDGLEARLATWKAPAEPRPVADLVASAQADLAKDTEASDVAAEATLQTALVQEPRNTEALGLWMEAIARGRGNQLPASELDALVRLGESALERFGRQPSLQVGLANLLLARGTPQDIVRTRILGQSAVDASRLPPPTVPGARSPAEAIGAPSPIWGTRARLVLAEAFTAASAGLALSLLQEVQDRDPTQRRVFNVRAAAHEAGGSPRAASADLQARLAVDPDEPRTARALARLFGQVGETAQARKLYERMQANPATQDGPAVVEMAALRAGAERAPAEAVKLVTHALQHGRLTGTERLRAQLCLARVARAAGDLSTASQAVAAALALSPDDVQVHVQSVLVELDRSAPDQAAAHLSAVVDRLGDPALAALLEGKVRAAQQRWQAAAEAFDRAAAADARRTDARLWAGAAWAMTGSREQSMQSVTPALQADPFRDGPGVPPLWPGDGLKGAAERLVLLSKDRSRRPAAPGRGRAPRAPGRHARRRGAGRPHPQDRRNPGGGAGVEVHPARGPGRQRGGARPCAGGGCLRRAGQRLRTVRARLGARRHWRPRGCAARAPRGADPEPGAARRAGAARRGRGPHRGHRVGPGTTPACHRPRSGVRLRPAGLVPSAAGGLIGRDAGAGSRRRWAGARARLEAGAEPAAHRAVLRPGQPGHRARWPRTARWPPDAPGGGGGARPRCAGGPGGGGARGAAGGGRGGRARGRRASRCFGPDAAAARLEGSKAFAKEVMLASGVRTAAGRAFTSVGGGGSLGARARGSVVVKADGLAAGKGVIVAHGADEAVAAVRALAALGEAGRTLVLEEVLEGEEV